MTVDALALCVDVAVATGLVLGLDAGAGLLVFDVAAKDEDAAFFAGLFCADFEIIARYLSTDPAPAYVLTK